MTLSPRIAVAAVAAGVLAAVLLPRAPAGLGIVLVAVALAVAVALVPRRAQVGRPGDGGAAGEADVARGPGEGGAAGEADAAPPPGDDGERPALGARAAPASDQPRIAHPRWAAVLGSLAVALAATAAIRDAEWVVAGELAGALVLGSIAVSSPRSWRATGLAALAAPLRMPSALLLISRTAAGAAPRASGGRVLAISRALILTGTLLAIFGALFATSDAAFAEIAGNILPDDLPLDDLPLRLVTFGIFTALAGGLVLATGVADTPARSPLLRIGRTEWLLALGALNLLFAAFVAVQIAVLFGGDGYVLETAGLTYAEYARQGFAQLVVVGVLTLAVVAAALRWARATGNDARLLRVLLASLCALSLVVLASALHRLSLYEEAFGFTRARLAVDAFLIFGGALFVLVIVALAIDRRDWLARATVLLGALAALAFAVSDPDGRIAERNVERFEATGSIDVDYLSHLSADAVPALTRLPEPLRTRALGVQRDRLAAGGDGFAGANLARARAREALR